MISKNAWQILIVDDEQYIHDNLELNLRDLTYNDKGVSFLHAYEAEEAKELIKEYPGVAIIFLDVRMETNDAGLSFVEYVREDIDNKNVRLLLYTGQPGIAPKREVSKNYVIDAYLDKNTSSNDDTYVATQLALKSYRDRFELDKNAKKDDLTLLNEISKIYQWFIESPKTQKTYETVLEKTNSILNLSQEVFAYYASTDMKHNLPVGTTKTQRLSHQEYQTLVNIRHIRVILQHTTVKSYELEKASILDTIIREVKKFASIRILPQRSKIALTSRLKNDSQNKA